MRNAIAAMLCFVAPLLGDTEIHHFEALLSPSNQVPPVMTGAAVGKALVAIRVERDAGQIVDAIIDFDLELFLTRKEEFIALHIHAGAAGASGPIVISSGGLDFDTAPVQAPGGEMRIYQQRISGQDPAVLQAVVGVLEDPGAYYVNLHSTSARPGLIRGQLQRRQPASSPVPPTPAAERTESEGFFSGTIQWVRSKLGWSTADDN